jgi:hypothetical protein
VPGNRNAADKEIAEVTALCSTCHQLNSQRIELDGRIIGLRANDPSFDVLWQELASVLADLRDAAGRLARVSAPHLTDVRSKANVLAMLLPSVGANGPVISDDQTRALALSLADDIIGLPG